MSSISTNMRNDPTRYRHNPLSGPVKSFTKAARVLASFDAFLQESEDPGAVPRSYPS